MVADAGAAATRFQHRSTVPEAAADLLPGGPTEVSTLFATGFQQLAMAEPDRAAQSLASLAAVAMSTAEIGLVLSAFTSASITMQPNEKVDVLKALAANSAVSVDIVLHQLAVQSWPSGEERGARFDVLRQLLNARRDPHTAAKVLPKVKDVWVDPQGDFATYGAPLLDLALKNGAPFSQVFNEVPASKPGLDPEIMSPRPRFVANHAPQADAEGIQSIIDTFRHARNTAEVAWLALGLERTQATTAQIASALRSVPWELRRGERDDVGELLLRLYSRGMNDAATLREIHEGLDNSPLVEKSLAHLARSHQFSEREMMDLREPERLMARLDRYS